MSEQGSSKKLIFHIVFNYKHILLSLITPFLQKMWELEASTREKEANPRGSEGSTDEIQVRA